MKDNYFLWKNLMQISNPDSKNESNVKEELEKEKKITKEELEKNYIGFDKLDSFWQEVFVISNLQMLSLKKYIFFLRKEKEELEKEEKNIDELEKLIIAARCALFLRDSEVGGVQGGISVSKKEKEEKKEDDKKILENFLEDLKNKFPNCEKRETDEVDRNEKKTLDTLGIVKKERIEEVIKNYYNLLEKALKNINSGDLILNIEPIPEELSKLLEQHSDNDEL